MKFIFPMNIKMATDGRITRALILPFLFIIPFVWLRMTTPHTSNIIVVGQDIRCNDAAQAQYYNLSSLPLHPEDGTVRIFDTVLGHSTWSIVNKHSNGYVFSSLDGSSWMHRFNTSRSQLLGIYEHNHSIKLTEFEKPNLYLRSTNNGKVWDKKIVSTTVKSRKSLKHFMIVSGKYCFLISNDILCEDIANIPKQHATSYEFQDMAYNGAVLIVSAVNFFTKMNRVFRTSDFLNWDYTDVVIHNNRNNTGYILKQLVEWNKKFIGMTVDGRICISDDGKIWSWLGCIDGLNVNNELFYHLYSDGSTLIASTWSSGYVFQSENGKIWNPICTLNGGLQFLYPRFSFSF